MKRDAGSIAMVLGVILIIVALVLFTVWVFNREMTRRADCDQLGGQYVNSRGAAFCVADDGRIVKVYRS